MSSAFKSCRSLTNIDIKIPSSTKNLDSTLREDSNIIEKITIEAIADEYRHCFSSMYSRKHKTDYICTSRK